MAPSVLDVLDSSLLASNSAAPAPNHYEIKFHEETLSILDYLEPSDASGKKGKKRLLEDGRTNAEADRMFLSDALNEKSRTRTNPTGGFQLRYDVETPLRSIDYGGPDQAQKLAEFVTKSIDNLSHGLTVREAMKKLGLESQRDLLPGLEVRLLGHQMIGVAWMLEKEKGLDKGGILADDMGLGKTVQMIATMAVNMPSVDDDCKTTLIIVPAALLQQWKDELDTKTNGIFEVHVHHGRDKLKKISELKSKDVVITSYQTLCMDFNVPKDVAPFEEADWLAKNGGILARMKFYRAIADEAQFIRNRATRSSISLAHIKAKYRWMLTGTPVTNTLADIYGLLRFGRFRPWNDWDSFNEHVAKVQIDDAPLAGSRAQAILQPILLRRTKDSELEGKPILQLPPKEIELVKLKFSPEEQHVYESFEKKTKIRLNKFIRERTLVKNHAAVLVMILRLRQLCCHPNLILSLTDEFEDPTLLVAGDNERELSRSKKIMGSAWVSTVKERFLVRAAASELLDFSDDTEEPAASCPVCKDVYVNGNGIVLACTHEICFDCSMNLKNFDIVHNGIFGYGNEKENIAIEREYETAVAKGFRPCPTCNKMVDLSPEKTFRSRAFEPTDAELATYGRSRRKTGKSRQRSPDIRTSSPTPAKAFEDIDVLSDSEDDLPDMAHIFQPPAKKRKISTPVKTSNDQSSSNVNDNETEGLSEAVMATWRKGDNDLEPSTKMLALIRYLRDWDVSGEKTICYSQWTSMLDLIETLFSRHGIRSLRFDGKMDRAARDSTLAQFKQFGGPKVLLISTKCGSVGLNLVSANRIINMDLSWNYAAESQAFDRCHRIGQDKTVYVKRLVVENTIEERMLLLQEVKVGLAGAALGEGTGAKLHKLSVKDIKYLFGMTTGVQNNTNSNNTNNGNINMHRTSDESESDEDE